MSIINIISNDELTLVQGVNGLFFCEESWVTQSRAVSRIGKVLPKEIIGTKDQSTNIVHPQTDRTKLSCQKHENVLFLNLTVSPTERAACKERLALLLNKTNFCSLLTH